MQLQPTQLLVLGTPHLSTLKGKYTPELLDKVIEKLLEFRPDLICIERLSGEVIEAMMSKPDMFGNQGGWVGPWWFEVAPKMQKLLKVSRVVAEQKLRTLLRQKRLGVEKRLELILYMLANYDVASAVLQWSYLSGKIKHTQTVIPKKVAKQLEQEAHVADEVYSIAVRLANTLKLKAMIPIDDHNYAGDETMSMKQYLKQWKKAGTLLTEANRKFIAESERRFNQAVKEGDLLPFYMYCNSPRVSKEVLNLEGESWLRETPPSRFADMRLAQWEVRNLNMASHIRQAAMLHSGKKMLVIVGYSHKVFLEHYLKPMLDISIVKL